MKRSPAKQEGESASELISKRIAELGDWRGETLVTLGIGAGATGPSFSTMTGLPRQILAVNADFIGMDERR